MFKFLDKDEQLKQARIELAKLKSIVGELPHEEVVEEIEQQEIKPTTLSDKVVTLEEEINVIFGS